MDTGVEKPRRFNRDVRPNRTKIPNVAVELFACLRCDNHSVRGKGGRGVRVRDYRPVNTISVYIYLYIYVTLWSLSTHSFERMARFSTNARFYFIFELKK